MTDLEATFYIIAIIYMAVMFILFIALFTVLLVIKKKIDTLYSRVEDKIYQVKKITGRVTRLFAVVKYFVKR